VEGDWIGSYFLGTLTKKEYGYYTMKQKRFSEKYYFGDVYDDYDQFLDFGKLVGDLIANYNFKSFLDIGCGCGNLVKEVKKQLEIKLNKDCDVQGVDISDFAVQRANVPFVKSADCTELPFNDYQFDLVYILRTFGYLGEQEELLKAMKEAYRVSKSIIIFEDVYDIPDESSDDYDPYRVKFLNKKGWFYAWKDILNDGDVIKHNKEEIVIFKDYEQ